MKRMIFSGLMLFFAMGFVGSSEALVIGTVPSNPTAADSVTLTYRTPFNGTRFVRDSYRTSMANNRIRVTLGELLPASLDPGINVDLQFDLGRFPAGAYLVDVYQSFSGQPDVLVQSDVAFTVTDNRTVKSAPFVRLNYADHWWTPAESGWGLFIWQDNLDRVLAAWFTYGADNRAEWYTIQAGQWIRAFQYQGQIVKTTGPVFSSFVPGSSVQAQSVGTAELLFTDANNGTFTYTLNGVTQTKVITRFKP